MVTVRTLSRSLALVAAVWLGIAMPPAKAGDAVDPATKAAIQAVITKQLDAFRQDDAKTAETYAAPGIRQQFPDPALFMAMVKAHYSALIRPKSTQFAEAVISPHGPLQKVTIVAADGTIWSAIYSFERVGGEWRITGCGMEIDRSQQDI